MTQNIPNIAQDQTTEVVSKFAVRDLFREVWLDLRSRPGRSALTALGTLIGIAMLIATLGLTASLDAQISARFDALTATEVTVTTVETGADNSSKITWDAPTKVLRINGTIAAGTLTEIKKLNIAGTPITDPSATSNEAITVFASSSQLGKVIHAELQGRYFDTWHDQNNAPVAVLGGLAAEQLKIRSVQNQPVIFINDQPLVVMGIITGLGRRTNLAQAVIIPNGYAKRFGITAPESLIIETKVGAAQIVADQVGLALLPNQPDLLATAVPPSPDLTRSQIAGDTSRLFIVLAAISLLIGGIGIANMTLVSVLERVPEIGLRRALGARRRHIVIQFLAGSVATGFVGGIAGAGIGLIVTAVVATAQNWPPTMPMGWLALAPLIGGVIGLLAGVYPAHRASRIEPIEALRTSG